MDEVYIDGPRNCDATTNRSINTSLKESDVFGGGEGSRECIRTPYQRSVFWDPKRRRGRGVLQDVLFGILVVVRNVPFA